MFIPLLIFLTFCVCGGGYPPPSVFSVQRPEGVGVRALVLQDGRQHLVGAQPPLEPAGVPLEPLGAEAAQLVRVVPVVVRLLDVQMGALGDDADRAVPSDVQRLSDALGVLYEGRDPVGAVPRPERAPDQEHALAHPILYIGQDAVEVLRDVLRGYTPRAVVAEPGVVFERVVVIRDGLLELVEDRLSLCHFYLSYACEGIRPRRCSYAFHPLLTVSTDD